MARKKVVKPNAFLRWADNLKRNNLGLLALLAVNVYFAINAWYVDYERILSLPWYLIPISPICTLFVPLLIIWLLIFKVKKQAHPIFTGFLFISLLLYGMMALVYYPTVLYLDGFSIWVVLVLAFVIGWAMQAFVLASEVRVLPNYVYFFIAAYFTLKAYTDTFLGTFEDVTSMSQGVLGAVPVFTVIFLALLGVAIWATWKVGQRNA
jgi:hypothetical protein